MTDPIVIIGGGLASARFARAYREAGGEDRMILFSADSEPPYHRPPLSKGYLRGEANREDMLVEERNYYWACDAELRLGCEAESLDTQSRLVRLANRETVRYGRLVVATGASPRRLDVPGVELENVFTLRTLDDATAIRDASGSAGRALVVGGSFIGTEVAASLCRRGLDVTIVHQGVGLHDALDCPELSEFLARMFWSMGVEVRLGSEVVELDGDGTVGSAKLDTGDEIECGLVVMGVGVKPDVAVVRGTRVEVDDGILVDERFRTSVDDVYAVGDVARFHDPVLERQRRIEHWDNASYQGDLLGRLLAGGEDASEYAHVSMFFTDVFDLTLEVYGDVEQHERVVCRGDFAARDVVAAYLDERDSLVAALALGQDDETTETLQELIAAGETLVDQASFEDRSSALPDAFRSASPSSTLR